MVALLPPLQSERLMIRLTLFIGCWRDSGVVRSAVFMCGEWFDDYCISDKLSISKGQF